MYIWHVSDPNIADYLYMVYSEGGGEAGSLPFLLPKFPFQRTESFKITMTDIAGRLILLTFDLKRVSTCFELSEKSI